MKDPDREGSHAAGERAYPEPDDPRKPAGPTDLTRRSWVGVLRRTVREFRHDHCTDWAAALTYYSVLSIFPGTIVLVSLLGLFGSAETANTLLDVVRGVAPDSAVETVEQPLRRTISRHGTAGAFLGFGLLLALWSASGYVGAFCRASNVIYEVDEGRPFWKLRPLQVLVTIITVLLTALVAVALVVTGPLAESVGAALGVGTLAVTLWSTLKWPALALMVSVIFSILYYAAPNVRQPRFRWLTPGGALALLIWVVASLGFGFYVANFGAYDKTYGTLGAVIVFIVWLWVSNLAILFGAEFDAETERARELQAGIDGAAQSIQLPPRSPADGD